LNKRICSIVTKEEKESIDLNKQNDQTDENVDENEIVLYHEILLRRLEFLDHFTELSLPNW
jgi:hypothetical protein